MDSFAIGPIEGFAIVFLLGFLFGRKTKKGSKKSTGRRKPFPSSTSSRTRAEMQRMPPTEKQEALVADMKAKGVLSAIEVDLLRSNCNRRFYSDLIDEHIVEYRKVAAQWEAAKRVRREKAATAISTVSVDSGTEQGRWLDFDHLPPISKFPIVLRDGLFSKREYAFYRVLRRSCGKKGLKVCPKVRLADILDVKTDDLEKNRVWFRTIAQLHVDFLILGKNDRFLFCVELDDSTHDTPEARKKDCFKDRCFDKTAVGLFRCRGILSDDDMDKWVDEHIKVAAERKARLS